MSIGKPSFQVTGDAASQPELNRQSIPSKSRKGLASRLREQRRRKDRRSLLESLEQRHLMAGPNLVGIQPNQGQLLFDGSVLNSSPRELVFRFDDNSVIDPTTLDGIRVTRAGDDAIFESARATSDLGTGGAVLLEFRAVQAGTAGEGVQVRFTSSNRPSSGTPNITVVGKVITFDLNSNPARPTQVRDLISAVSANTAASQLLRVFSVSGATSFALGTSVLSGTSVTLRGANAADATTDLGTSNAVRVRFLAATTGAEGRGTQVILQRADAGGAANPLVLVNGNQVTVRVNSNVGNETTVAQLLTAINTNPEASKVVLAILEAGSATTLIGNRTGLAQTISLTGATDILVQPGFVGIGNSPNEVVFRFAETLPDDTYQIDIFGTSSLALTNILGEAFNNGENASRRFTLNLGPQVLAVVPEPVRRTTSGLSPEVGIIEVHFNGDSLDLALAQNRSFYQLVYTADTVTPADDRIVNPTTVVYNTSTNIARLTFDGPLSRLPNGSGGFLSGAARLRIGTSQTQPLSPTSTSVGVDPGDSTASALALGDLTSIDSSGVRSVRLQSEILNTVEYGLDLPGADAPGVRNIRPDDPSRLLRTVPFGYFRQGPDAVDGITTIQYDFASSFRGDDPTTPAADTNKTYFNLISEQQKQRVREVLSLFSQYLGVQFVERPSGATSGAFFTIAVGDLRSIGATLESAQGGLAVATADRNLDGQNDLVVLDFQDFEQSDDDQFGGEFFRGAMLAVGQLLGYGYADGLPQPVTQSTNFVFNRARAETTLGTNPNILFEIVSVPDAQTNTITNVNFALNVAAATAVPAIALVGGTITITLSSNPANPTLASDLVNAVAANPVSNTRIRINVLRGAVTSPIGLSAQAASVPLITTTNEPSFPSVTDIINGQYLYRPDSSDIDLYRFSLRNDAKVSIQTFAERLSNSSLLDSHVRLYRENAATGAFVEVAQNDDYFSNDSLIELSLTAGNYVVGVSSSGNNSYNPVISGTGFGGKSQGAYELRITTELDANLGIRDTDRVLLDGDGDGKPGGVFDFWFVPSDQSNTLFVDKSATTTGTGSLATPFRNLNSAVAAATPGTTIRVLANGGTDGRLETPGDNFSYQVGFANNGSPLADGSSLDLPRGVRLVIDAGAIFKMRASRIGVGSTAPLVDRSDAAIQVLGTPTIVGSNGLIARDSLGAIIPGSVYFTSFNDRTLGQGNSTVATPAAQAGDWGGIDLRSDLDTADSTRRNRENEGVFLNHIQFADMRFGGGQVRVDGRGVVVSPVDMALTRATIINSRITNSADAAIAATPDTFTETRFDEPVFQQGGAFTPSVSRVGPEIRGNRVVDNTLNGLFVRIATRTGDTLQPLTSQARFDDSDIVHIISENLTIKGTAGGPLAPSQAPSSLVVSGLATPGSGQVPAGTYVYRLSFASSSTESAASSNTIPIELTAAGQIRLNQLPVVPAGSGFTQRRLYRASVAADGTVSAFLKVADLNGTDTSYIDRAATGTSAIPNAVDRLVARTDASLKIDPGTIVKLGGVRIDVLFGADFIAEGTAENRVVITSLKDGRYGAGGTFDTNSDEPGVTLERGDWGGIYVGHTSSASIDQATIAGAGGVTRIEGGFASFNAIEVHQGDLRLANSRLESNADGRGFVNVNELDRLGRGDNASGTVFVRGAQPVIVGNDMIDGNGPAISFDVNSLVWTEVADPGRSRGGIDAFASIGNSGPLVSGNRLANNSLNGLEVRGGQIATEVVWDDVDIVHIVRDIIEVPNQHVYGGLRLESDARGSLVVKFSNTDAVGATLTTPAIPGRTAGIVAGGALASAREQFVDIADRIGGSLQVVGHPDFPVVLTALVDDTIGSGFLPSGQQNVDTDNNGIRRSNLTSDTDTVPTPALLPLGPQYDRTNIEVNNGTRIDNDIDPNVIGFFESTPVAGGEVTNISVTGVISANGNLLTQQNFAFLNTTLVDIDFVFPVNGRAPIRLSASTITQVPTLISPDRVQSSGLIDLLTNGDQLLSWTSDTFFVNNRAVMYTTINFSTVDARPFSGARPGVLNRVSNIQVANYLDVGIGAAADDVLYSVGNPGEQDFRAYVIDSQSRVGFSHGGVYVNDGINQLNANYLGWTSDDATRLLNAINVESSNYTLAGNIDVSLPVDPTQPTFPNSSAGRLPGDVGTAFAWSLSPNESRSRVTTLVEWLPSDPADPFPITLPPSIDGVGSWNGITIREATNDRNVAAGSETESRLTALGDSNAITSQSQFLGELAPNSQSGDENRRLGFIVDGSILAPSDVDVYSFIAEAGTQIWLDIDRADLSLDSVLELVDANGRTLVLSDDSLREARGDISRLLPTGAAFEASNARSLNQLQVPAGSPSSAYQDAYSTNSRDAGMRLVLPGLPGQRNLYHVRVRSSNSNGADREARLLNANLVRGGLTSGNYQLQVRLSEKDESGGTQIRYSDIRYAVNGIQVIGGPLHSPLVGDEYETAGNNDAIGNAQPLGLFDIGVDGAVVGPQGPLSSDRLAKSIGGALSGATDVDWFRFDVNYQNLTRDGAALYLSTIFDVDYAAGFARSDVAIYVFNAAGELILVGGDSNVADDQPTGLNGTNNNDLSRGSADSLDPFIGAAELVEGNYFVAVVNQSQIPLVLNQFTNAATVNPLLRLEPIDSIIRIAEDRVDSVGGGTASPPTVPLLFNGESSSIPYTLNDQVIYTLDNASIGIANPFTGVEYGSIGAVGAGFRDFSFLPNGELFAYSLPDTRVDPDLDLAFRYFRINSENGALTNIGVSGIETFHVGLNQTGVPTVVDSDDGIQVEGLTFRDNSLGFFIGNRPLDRSGLGNARQNDYFQNILYAFDPQTGQATGFGVPNRQVRTIGTLMVDERADGAGTQIRERGYIETGTNGAPQISGQLVVQDATNVLPNGTGLAIINDGDAFSLNVGGQLFRVELDSGPVLNFTTNNTGAFPIDGAVFSLTTAAGTQIYELDSGPVIVIDAAQVVDGATVTVTDATGVARLFEFNSNAALVNANATPVVFTAGATSDILAVALATAISGADFGANGFATPGQGRVDLTGDSVTVAPAVAGAGLTVTGTAGSQNPLVPGTNIIPIRENFTGQELAQAVATVTGGAVAGSRVNFRNVISTNVTNLTARNLVTQTGANGVTSGSTGVRFLVSDTAPVIAIRIAQVINSTQSLQAAGVSATFADNIVTFQSATLNGGNGTVSPSFAVGNVPPGGIVRGIASIGQALYAVSDRGGLYVVNNPTATVQGPIGNYVATATDLLGLTFTGLTRGPLNLENGRFANLLFGVTATGDVYAFDTLGRLQPVFAGGATSVNIGAGTQGIDFSTLDLNLWHVTDRRATDAGHGINATSNGTRPATPGGQSFYFGAETTDEDIIANALTSEYAVPRQDGQAVRNTYNFPGGAKGAIESNAFNLTNVSAADMPTLYFNYFLNTDGFDSVDPTGGARDTFRVYAITDDGVEHSLTTNNLATRPLETFDDEFDDPTESLDPILASLYDDQIDVEVQPIFDNTNSWRQARVSLSEFAGQRNLRLRLEFSSGASYGDGTLGIRTIDGSRLVDGQSFVVGGQTFELDLGTSLSIPSGVQIANFYARPGTTPATRVVAVVGGVTYVLNDGSRTVNAGEVSVPLQVVGGGLLPTLTADAVATLLADAIRTRGVTATTTPFNFIAEPNDEIAFATRLPAVSGNAIITGTGTLEAATDVDLFRIDVAAGATIRASISPVIANAFVGNVRLFDAQGQQLAIGTTTTPATFTAASAQTVYVGYSSNSNSDYNPLVAGSGSPGVAGNYNATVELIGDLRVIQSGSRLQITGGFSASGGADGLVVATGVPGTTGIPIVVDAAMNANQIALELQRAIARQFSRGVATAYPVNESVITLAGLTVTELGPFGISGLRSGDTFGSNGAARAVANNFEGVYIDDFIIGFAERGELATGANAVSTFVTDPSPTFTNPAQTPSVTVTGSYQLEIRDASEYVNSLEETTFRAFDTNDRLSDGLAIRMLPAASIVDGASFQLSDGVSVVTFEFDIETAPGVSNSVTPGRVRIGIPSGGRLPAGDDGTATVGRAVIAAINNPSVRSLINVTAVAADGVDSFGNDRINLFGNVVISNFTGALAEVIQRTLRGDKNRDRTEQGMILIENSRFAFNSDSGIDIVHDSSARATGVNAANSTPSVVVYPRNLVELNTQNLIPGVVVQSNVLAYNQNAGVRITGLAAANNNASAGNPVPFDRVVNNTIVGGVITSGPDVIPATFAGVDFPAGAVSFADAIVSFLPGTGIGTGFGDSSRALGAPDGTGRGVEPIDGQTTVSLGSGGVLTVQFADNLLTGSDDARPDLIIFETGEIESVRVAISRDGLSYIDVGVLGGVDTTIDIDRFGFGSQDRFAFVRLTDLRQGTSTSGPAGADIDAIGALSTATADVYLPGSQGIVVRQNAAPTLLNNVLANSQTGLSIDTSSSRSVVGGTTYYRNAVNARNSQASGLGTFAEVLPSPLELFVDPLRLAFAPRAGVPIIDSSIDSLEDRASLAVVRNSIGLPPSPIFAPRLDVNGQLRADDPTVESPPGVGERVFKDRGAEDRADQVGPRAVLVSPRAVDLGLSAGQAETRGTVFDAFDIQLIDGIGPADPTPGVGIDDASVTSNAVLLSKDGVTLVEGVDYRMGYDASNNVIRLTPIAGIWEDNSTYVVRLLDASDSVLRFTTGTVLTDGAITTLLATTGTFRDFEVERGVTITVDTDAVADLDGQVITVFDGTFSLRFELNTNTTTGGTNIPVTVPVTASSADVAAALAAAIDASTLNLTVNVSGASVQLLGPSSLASATPLTPASTAFTVAGTIGTRIGFGIGIPTVDGAVAPSVVDGQTFVIRRGVNLVRTFELDFGGGVTTPGAIAVPIGALSTLDQVANAIVNAIGGAGLGLAPVNLGQGRIGLGGDANYSLDVSDSTLVQLGSAGQRASVPVVLPINATNAQIVTAYATAIAAAGLTGVTTAIVGDRLILEGVAAVSGLGAAVILPIIRDEVGNLLQSNGVNGRTELTIFVGGGFDYGDAGPGYTSLQASGGPRHKVDRGLTLGDTITPDADAILNNGDIDDGVDLIGNAASGFNASFTIDVRSDGRPFFVDAWIDWDRDGLFETTEVTRYRSANAAGSLPILGVGVNTVNIQVPAGIKNGATFARFRLSEVSGLGPNGDADSGEVEDLSIIVQSNPYQNPLVPTDVNKTGTVTPLDALNIINLLAQFNRNGGVGSIPLNPPPAFMTDILNGRFLPDANGNGNVTAQDALNVLNEISRRRKSGALGEGEAFIPQGQGLFASPLTVATSLSQDVETPVTVTTVASTPSSRLVSPSSVFDSPQVVALDDIINDLAGDDRESTTTEVSSVDAVFSGLGLGL